MHNGCGITLQSRRINRSDSEWCLLYVMSFLCLNTFFDTEIWTCNRISVDTPSMAMKKDTYLAFEKIKRHGMFVTK